MEAAYISYWLQLVTVRIVLDTWDGPRLNEVVNKPRYCKPPAHREMPTMRDPALHILSTWLSCLKSQGPILDHNDKPKGPSRALMLSHLETPSRLP